MIGFAGHIFVKRKIRKKVDWYGKKNEVKISILCSRNRPPQGETMRASRSRNHPQSPCSCDRQGDMEKTPLLKKSISPARKILLVESCSQQDSFYKELRLR